MNYNEIEIIVKNLNAKIGQDLTNSERYPIYDGALNLKEYFESPIKIAWMLKEAYDSEDGEGGGWEYGSLFDSDEKIDEFMKGVWRATWHPIVYISHSILNDFINWNDINYIKDEPTLAYVIRKIAIINAQKLPAIGVSNSNDGTWMQDFEKNKPFIQKQLDILNPDILIFGNTYSVYKDMLNLPEYNELPQIDTTAYLLRDNKVYIFDYHPSQRGGNERYAKRIIEIAKIWYAYKK